MVTTSTPEAWWRYPDLGPWTPAEVEAALRLEPEPEPHPRNVAIWLAHTLAARRWNSNTPSMGGHERPTRAEYGAALTFVRQLLDDGWEPPTTDEDGDLPGRGCHPVACPEPVDATVTVTDAWSWDGRKLT